MTQSRLIASGSEGEMLDPMQLERLEQSFRDWVVQSSGKARKAARTRILLFFLLIRYTGAKLNEVLALVPERDLRLDQRSIVFRSQGPDAQSREVQISERLADELEALLQGCAQTRGQLFAVDPAFVRRKFYERAEACGFEKKRCGPEMIRKARAVELMRDNMPLPAVQRLLGHASPNLITSYVSFSDEDMRAVTQLHMERESGRKTSARNSFFAKVLSMKQGEVQTLVDLATPDGQALCTMITNASAERLGLKPGRLVTAEIKAPWLTLERCDRPGAGSMENMREGVIVRITPGQVNTECAVRIPDGTELCAVLSTPGFAKLALEEGDPVRVLFSCYAVVLHAE